MMPANRHPIAASMRPWPAIAVKTVAWLIIAALGLIAAATAAACALSFIMIVGYELGLWGPPFGGE